MKEYYLIQSMISQGFFDRNSKTFRGIIFATKYIDEELAIEDAERLVNERFTLIKVYEPNRST